MAAPDAPPVSDNAPATPNSVTAFVRPFRFEFRLPCDMVEVSHFTPAPSSISIVRLVAYRFISSGNLAKFADPPRLVFGEQLGCCSPPRLALIIDWPVKCQVFCGASWPSVPASHQRCGGECHRDTSMQQHLPFFGLHTLAKLPHCKLSPPHLSWLLAAPACSAIDSNISAADSMTISRAMTLPSLPWIE